MSLTVKFSKMYGRPSSTTHVQCISLHLLSFLAGMMAYYEVKSCDRETVTPVADRVLRNYYLAAEKVEWNYAPSGKDLITGASLTEDGRWADNSERNHCCVCLAPTMATARATAENGYLLIRSLAIYILKTGLIEVYVQMFYISVAILLQSGALHVL